ncbi:MAG: exodeoxyribonuclease VII small subunit [Alistipes sp.]|nr:exodeoxyribonuclease VII small subunit [Alistipes sp.]MBR0394081.1 exodeoxyribonuclease VII small subunit [Alistipes sp.]
MAKKSNEISYEEAMAEVEQILSELQQEAVNVDTLSERVKRASELITLCRAKLRKAEGEVTKIFAE